MEKDEYQFLNAYYFPIKYDTSGKRPVKKADDAIIIFYRKNGVQQYRIIKEPDYSFYISKHDKLVQRYQDHRKFEDVDKVTVQYHNLNKFLAEFNQCEEEYYALRSNKNKDWMETQKQQREFVKRMQLNPNLYRSDLDIIDYYKIEFVKQHGLTIKTPTKVFFDIETNGASTYERAKYPVNLNGIYFSDTNEFYLCILDWPHEWPTFHIFKERVLSGEFEKSLRNDPEMNGEFERLKNKKAKLTNVDTKYYFEFYKKEEDLIRRHFELLHIYKPDFCVAFNFLFDNMTLINRLQHLLDERHSNERIENIICDNEFPEAYRKWNCIVDKSDKTQWYEKWHHFWITGYTSFICSMAMYTHIRKAKGVLPGYGLNDISMFDLEKGKLDYYSIADSPVDLPYKDFTTFAFYNIKDVWVMAELEIKNHDIEAILNKARYTRLSMATRPTIILRNELQLTYEKYGFIIGNNYNQLTNQTKDKDEYVGAIVAQPELNTLVKTPLFPYASRHIRPYVIDLDATSMYPSLVIAHNIYKTTLLFNVHKIGSINGEEIQDPNGVIDIEECFDNYLTGHTMKFGHDYLQLPSIEELINDFYNESQSNTRE
jgi:DNA polymerase elongation subunit (family B)